jgi:hypothetical protein
MEFGSYSIDGNWKMFRLRDLKNGKYQIHSTTHHQAFEGTPKSIFATALKMGVKKTALFIAFNELHSRDHDYADFGTNGFLLRTGKDRR